MLKRILYSSPLFAVIFWLGLFTAAIPLASRIVTGQWNMAEIRKPDTTIVAIVTFGLWIIVSVLRRSTERHYKEQDDREAMIMERAIMDRMKREDDEKRQ